MYAVYNDNSRCSHFVTSKSARLEKEVIWYEMCLIYLYTVIFTRDVPKNACRPSCEMSITSV